MNMWSTRPAGGDSMNHSVRPWVEKSTNLAIDLIGKLAWNQRKLTQLYMPGFKSKQQEQGEEVWTKHPLNILSICLLFALGFQTVNCKSQIVFTITINYHNVDRKPKLSPLIRIPLRITYMYICTYIYTYNIYIYMGFISQELSSGSHIPTWVCLKIG